MRGISDIQRQQRERNFLRKLRKRHAFHKAGGWQVEESYTLVPVRLIEDCAKRGLTRLLSVLVSLKLEHGHTIAKREIRDWRRLVGLGWARESRKAIHPQPWRHFAKIYATGEDKQGGYTGVRITKAQLELGTACWFHVIQEYKVRLHRTNGEGSLLQETGQPTDKALLGGRAIGRKHGRKKEQTQSPHNGGIALSLMAEAFNKTKPWASQMRRALEKADMCHYARRYFLATRREVIAAKLCDEGHLYRFIKDPVAGMTTFAKEITSLAIPKLVLSFRYKYVQGGVV